jgi:hypothetical protein
MLDIINARLEVTIANNGHILEVTGDDVNGDWKTITYVYEEALEFYEALEILTQRYRSQ